MRPTLLRSARTAVIVPWTSTHCKAPGALTWLVWTAANGARAATAAAAAAATDLAPAAPAPTGAAPKN